MTAKPTHFARGRLAAVWVASAFVSSSALADVVDTTWLGGTGSWNDPTKWSGGVVPNNSGSTTFRAFVPSGNVTASSNIFLTLDALSVAGAATLTATRQITLNGEAVIDGWLDTRGMTIGGADALHGSGKIVLTEGLLRSAQGITVPANLTIDARDIGQVGDIAHPVVNHGRIVGNFARIYGSSIRNYGSIEGSGYFDGTFTRSDLGQVTGSLWTIRGTMLNTGQTFRLDSTTSDWMLGGLLQGGTIETADNRKLYIPYVLSGPSGMYNSRLDNVVVNGDISLGNAATLTILNGTLTGNGDVRIGPPPIEGPSRIVSGTSTLTIDPGMVLHGGGGHMSVFGWGSGLGTAFGAIINHGTIRSEYPHGQGGFSRSGELTIEGQQFFNDGTLATLATSFLYATRDVTFGTGGVLDIMMGPTDGLGMLRVNGSLDLMTTGDLLILTSGPEIVAGTFYRIATTTGGVFGQFASVTPGFEVMYTPTEIFARRVPEPAGVVIALAPLSCLRRRRLPAQ